MIEILLKEKLLQVVQQSKPEQQQKVLEFAEGFMTPQGVDGKSLLRFAGMIAFDNLNKIQAAIKNCRGDRIASWEC
jgi:hypothetical protein